MPFIEKYCEAIPMDHLCKKEIYNFTAKEALYNCQWVQQCPDDKTQVMPWDGKDIECRIGYVKHPCALRDCPEMWVKPGQCVDIVIHREWGGREMGCKTEGWFCDESVPPKRVWYSRDSKGNECITKAPNSDEVVEIVGCLQPFVPALSGGFDFEYDLVCDSEGTEHYMVKEVTVDAKTGEKTHTVKYYDGPDCVNESTPVGPIKLAARKTKEVEVISQVKIDVVPGEIISLDPIPADAIGAEIIFEGDDCCVFRVKYDGSLPATGEGEPYTNEGCIEIGCTDSSTSPQSEVQNFRVITEDDCGGCMQVTFFKQS